MNKRFLALCLAACLALALCGCANLSALQKAMDGMSASSEAASEPLGQPASQSAPAAPESRTPGTRRPPRPAASESSDPSGSGTLSAEGQAALSQLQAEMEYMPHVLLAAVWLGAPTWHDPASLAEYLKEHFPNIVQAAPFLLEIPEERILGEGETLFCVIPRDGMTSVSVNQVRWKPTGGEGAGYRPVAEEILYRSEYAEPLLVFADLDPATGLADIQIHAVAGNGAEVEWYPAIYPDTFVIDCPVDEDYASLVWDIGVWFGTEGQEESGLPPTEMGMANTTWVSDDGWYLFLTADGSAPGYAGTAEAIHFMDGSTDWNGVWKIEDGGLHLKMTDEWGNLTEGNYPLEVSLSGEELYFWCDMNTGKLPAFLEDGVRDIVHMVLVYN